MNATTVAVDLAKSIFQLAVADDQWRLTESHRLTRKQFEAWFPNRNVSLVIMEACGSAHHWARWLTSLGIEVRLLPAAYVRAYVRRNKTDAADARALLEAARASDIEPVRVKSVEQQALQGLHRIRSLWMATRTARINALRGFCGDFGLVIPVGARTGIEAISRVLADPASAVPTLTRCTRHPKVKLVCRATRRCFESRVSLVATNSSRRRSRDSQAGVVAPALPGTEQTRCVVSRDRGHLDNDVRQGKSHESVGNSLVVSSLQVVLESIPFLQRTDPRSSGSWRSRQTSWSKAKRSPGVVFVGSNVEITGRQKRSFCRSGGLGS